MKLYTPNNFIKDQVLPSQYRTKKIFYRDADAYIEIQNKNIYTLDDDNKYVLIGRLSDSYDAIWFASDMDFLNRKLEKAQRQLTIWDFYRITEVVDHVNEFEIKQNSLIALTGLIINCGKFIFNQEEYSTGDIIFRMADGTLQHIRAERGGMFFPSRIERISGNNFNFSYSFINTPPIKDSIDIQENNNVWDASAGTEYKNINFEGLRITSPIESYSISQIIDSGQIISFNPIYKNGNLVQPIIKTFIGFIPIGQQSTNYEEIYTDYQLTFSDNQFHLEFHYSGELFVIIK